MDLNTVGKLPVKRELLTTEVKDRRWSSMSSTSNNNRRGSISHVSIVVLLNTLCNVDSDTGMMEGSQLGPSKAV